MSAALISKAADWVEEEHPRDDHGKFVESSGGPGTERELTTKEALALREYRRMDYPFINGRLRQGIVPDEAKTMVDGLVKIGAQPSHSYWRGAYFSKENWDTLGIKPGSEFSDPGFLSCTTSKPIADKFIWKNPDRVGVLFKVRGNAFPMPASNEKEHLFLPGTKFKVTDIKTQTTTEKIPGGLFRPAREVTVPLKVVSLTEIKPPSKSSKIAKMSVDEAEQLLNAMLPADEWIRFYNEIAPELESAAMDAAPSGFADQAKQDALQRAAEMVGMRRNPETGELTPNPEAEWAIAETTREMLRGLIQDEDVTDLPSAIRESIAFSPYRSRMIAQTETAMVQNQTALNYARASSEATGERMMKIAVLSNTHVGQDDCDMNADEGPIPIDEEFPTGDMSPPFHPFCACDIQFVKASDTDEGESEKVLKAADWVESEHPRDETGKFTESGQPLNQTERAAIRHYTVDGHLSLNGLLRGTNPVTGPIWFAKNREIRELSSACAKIPQVDGTFYRGAALKPSVLDQLKAGHEWTDQGFVSCSTRKELANAFAVDEATNRNLTPVVFAIKGTAASIAPYSSAPEEEEHLFQPGTKFRVISSADYNPKGYGPVTLHLVELEEVKPELHKAADWVESEHPRDEHGKFTPSGSEGKARFALKEYVGFPVDLHHGHVPVNDDLRHGIVTPQAKLLSDALTQMPQVDGTFYRGTYLPKSVELKPGSEFSDPAFLSCSTSKEMGEGFLFSSQMQAGGKAAILELHGTAANVSSFNPGESEHIFQPGTRFKITSVEPDKITATGATIQHDYVKLEEVKPELHKAADWVEELHPRDEQGKFTESGQTLSSDDKAHLRDYTREGYIGINAKLRQGIVTEEAKNVSAALAKLKASNHNLYRGADSFFIQATNLKVGDELSDKGFLSCSSNASVAENAMVDTLLHIKGHAAAISGYSVHPGESEYLFQPGSRFRVNWIDKNAEGKYRIQLEEIVPKLKLLKLGESLPKHGEFGPTDIDAGFEPDRADRAAKGEPISIQVNKDDGGGAPVSGSDTVNTGTGLTWYDQTSGTRRRRKKPPKVEESEDELDLEKIIRRRGGKWHVYSHDGKKHLGGPYDSKSEAVERLRQIEYFKEHPSKADQSTAGKILLIRHCEKPIGADSSGEANLTEVGLHHAQELATEIPEKYGIPDIIFAAKNEPGSYRPVQTATPLADRYDIPVIDDIPSTDIDKLVSAVHEYADDFVLIVWRHHELPDVAKALGMKNVPDKWPDDDFDTQWLIDNKIEKGFDPDEPRDESGQWTSEGGGSLKEGLSRAQKLGIPGARVENGKLISKFGHEITPKHLKRLEAPDPTGQFKAMPILESSQDLRELLFGAKLTDDQLEAINESTGYNAERRNYELRQGHRPTPQDRVLVSALQSMPAYTDMAWRGISRVSYDQFMQGKKIGSVVRDPAFMSTSKDEKLAFKWAHGGVILAISGETGRDVSGMGALRNSDALRREKEVLFMPSTQMRITSVDPENRIVYLKEEKP